MSRKRRARAFLMTAAGALGIGGFLRDAFRGESTSNLDLAVLGIAAGFFAAGIVMLIRGNHRA